MLAQHLHDVRSVLGANVDEQNILRGRQPHFRLKTFDHTPQAGLELITLRIPYPAILDKEAEEIIAVALLMPAEGVALFREFEGSHRLELKSRALFQFLAKPIQPALG